MDLVDCGEFLVELHDCAPGVGGKQDASILVGLGINVRFVKKLAFCVVS